MVAQKDMPTVLVVEDEFLLSMILADTLRDMGYRVMQAADGALALTILEHVHIALVISDIRMPRLDGLKLAEILQARPLKLILMTGYAPEGIPAWVAAAEIPVLQKPLNLDLLPELVSAYLQPATAGGGADAHTSVAPRVICVLDDEEAERYLMHKMLMQANYQVHLADGPEAALHVLEHSRVDLLLADVNLRRGLNGIDVARLVQGRFPDVKIVFASAYDLPVNAPRETKVLRKPLSPQLLVQEVQSALAH